MTNQVTKYPTITLRAVDAIDRACERHDGWPIHDEAECHVLAGVRRDTEERYCSICSQRLTIPRPCSGCINPGVDLFVRTVSGGLVEIVRQDEWPETREPVALVDPEMEQIEREVEMERAR